MVALKQYLSQLAVCGGQPVFSDHLHVGRPNIPQDENRARLLQTINGMLDRRWLANHGPLVQEFEQAIARITGARHAIAVCNATLGLQVTARACGLTGEVIVPSFTFPATAHALSWIGLTPVFADVEPGTHTLDPRVIEDLITPQTSGIIGVHLWGNACLTEWIERIAARHQLQVIYDAAPAFGCSHRGRMIGSFGRAEVFSFHATKFINSFEGGAITTNDDALARQLRLLINFGFDGYDHSVAVGINAKLSEASAAMGLAGIEMMDELVLTNRRNYAAYAAELSALPGVRLLPFDDAEKHNYQYVVVEWEGATLTRDQLLQVLWAEGVRARRYFYPGCHRMAPYCQGTEQPLRKLPVTERLADTVLALPTGASVTPAQIAEIGNIIRLAYVHAGVLAAHLTEARQMVSA